jgi:hypothetical protein
VARIKTRLSRGAGLSVAGIALLLATVGLLRGRDWHPNVHNHPSGDIEPSADDLRITQILVQVGRLVGH